MAETSIEWATDVWNPTTGCDKVSRGCRNCYALRQARRLKGYGNPRYQVDGDPKSSGPGFGLTMHEDLLEVPLRWKRPRVVFVNSMSDLFHPDVTDDFIGRVFDTMRLAHQHTFLVLTKRPGRMRDVVLRYWQEIGAWGDADVAWNVWLGVSIENRHQVRRADLLRETPAFRRFISAEPLVGPIHDELDLTAIDWLIVGGESGPGKIDRMDPAWWFGLRDLCLDRVCPICAGARFVRGWKCRCLSGRATEPFFKQTGTLLARELGLSGKGGKWDELPQGYRLRERPPLLSEMPAPWSRAA